MADNVVLNSGSGGVTAATDDVAGIHYQRIKLVDGTLDSTAAIPGDATNGLDVDVTRVIPGTSAAHLGKAEDAAHASGDTGVMALAVRNDTRGALAGTDGDYSPPQLNASGDLRTELSSIAGTVPDTNSGNKSAGTLRVTIATDQVQLTNALKVDGSAVTQPISGTVTANLSAGTNTNEVVGDVAHDAVAAGNPLLIGGYASAAAPADVSADADAVRTWHLRNGSPVVNIAAGGSLVGATSNALDVNIKSGGGTGGTALADNAAFTRGTTSETPVAGVVETSAPTLTNGKAGALSLTTGGALRVDVTSGGIPGFAEDAAATSGDTGIVVLAVRQDTIASSTSTDGDYGTLKLNSVGRLYEDSSLSQIAGNAVSTGNGTAGTGCQRVTIASDNTNIPVFDQPATSGGLSFSHVTSAATNNKTQAKGSAGQLYFVNATNTNAAVRYLKIFDKTSAAVTAGTTAADYQFAIPGNTAGAGVTFNIDKGIAHANGITYMITTGVALTDNTATAANEQVVTIGYK